MKKPVRCEVCDQIRFEFYMVEDAAVCVKCVNEGRLPAKGRPREAAAIVSSSRK